MCFTFTLTDTRSVTRRRFTTATATRMFLGLSRRLESASAQIHDMPQRSRDQGSEAFPVQASLLADAPRETQSIPIYGGRTIELFCMMIVVPALMILLPISQSHFPSEAFHGAPGLSEIALRYADDSRYGSEDHRRSEAAAGG
jgi:hypothetical protein